MIFKRLKPSKLFFCGASLSFLLTVAMGKSNAQSHCVLSGSIKSARQSYLVLKYNEHYGIKEVTDTIRPARDGSFRHEWKFKTVDKTALLEFDGKRHVKIWSRSGREIQMNIPDSSDPVIFSGKSARIQQYFQDKEKREEAAYKAVTAGYPELYKAGFDSLAYLRIDDSLLKSQINFLKAYFSKARSADEQLFLQREEVALRYRHLYYQTMNENKAVTAYSAYRNVFNLPASGTNANVAEPTFNDRSPLDEWYARQFTRTFFWQMYREKRKQSNTKPTMDTAYETIFRFIDRFAIDSGSNAAVKAAFLDGELIGMERSMRFEENNTEALYQKFIDRIRYAPGFETEASLLEQKLNKLVNTLSVLKRGAVAPEISLIDSTGKTYSWTDFRGKVIYVDVWASWCGPCLQTIPAWNALQTTYKDNNNVVFITISIDDSLGNWKKALKKYQPAGLHFVSSGTWKSELAGKFKIGAVPSNILIDKEGKIIELRADRPEKIDLNSVLK